MQLLGSKFFIYALQHPITNEVRYIGKTSNPNKRFSDHISGSLSRRNTYKAKWIYSLRKQGLKPVMKILVETDEGKVDILEKELISHYKQFCKLTNLTEGGEGCTGRVVSEKERRDKSTKLKEYYKNKPNSMLGKRHTEQTKKLQSNLKLGDLNPRRKHTKGILQFDLDGNFIRRWNSGIEASKELKISAASIYRCANRDGYRSAGKFKWVFE